MDLAEAIKQCGADSTCKDERRKEYAAINAQQDAQMRADCKDMASTACTNHIKASAQGSQTQYELASNKKLPDYYWGLGSDFQAVSKTILRKSVIEQVRAECAADPTCTKQAEEAKLEAVSLALDFVPVLGDIKGLYEADSALDYVLVIGGAVGGPITDTLSTLYKGTKYASKIADAANSDYNRVLNNLYRDGDSFFAVRWTELQAEAVNVRSLDPALGTLKGNVGVATIRVNGEEARTVKAYSRYGNDATTFKEGFESLPPDSNYILKPNDTPAGGVDRAYDTEFKILESFAQNNPNTSVSGSIDLYTERPPCNSCTNVISKFIERFPNMEIRVFHSRGEISAVVDGKLVSVNSKIVEKITPLTPAQPLGEARPYNTAPPYSGNN